MPRTVLEKHLGLAIQKEVSECIPQHQHSYLIYREKNIKHIEYCKKKTKKTIYNIVGILKYEFILGPGASL